MKTSIKIFLTLIVLSLYSSGFEYKSINKVDSKLFSGKWYEIARTYNSFQKNCVDSNVEYIFTQENQYDVYNRCFEYELGGKKIQYSGTAKLTNNKLDMTYFWIFTKRYHILYLNNTYTTAVISDEDYENLWIMSRTKKMDKKEKEFILNLLSKKIDLKKLIFEKKV